MRMLIAFLLIVILAVCQTTHPEAVQTQPPKLPDLVMIEHDGGFKKGQRIPYITMICVNEKAIMAFARADAASQEHGEAVYQLLRGSGLCLNIPRQDFVISRVIGTYRDWGGKPTQIIEMISHRVPGKKAYLLIWAHVAKKIESERSKV